MSKVWIYEKGGIGSGNWYVGWYENGKRRSKARPSKSSARMYAGDIQAKLNAGLEISIAPVSWQYLKEQYKEARQADKCKPTTIVEHTLTLKHFERLVGELKSSQINQASIDKFKQLRGKGV